MAGGFWISCRDIACTTRDTTTRNIVQALQTELEARGPVMLQSHVPELAGELAKRLCDLAGRRAAEGVFLQQRK